MPKNTWSHGATTITTQHLDNTKTKHNSTSLLFRYSTLQASSHQNKIQSVRSNQIMEEEKLKHHPGFSYSPSFKTSERLQNGSRDTGQENNIETNLPRNINKYDAP